MKWINQSQEKQKISTFISRRRTSEPSNWILWCSTRVRERIREGNFSARKIYIHWYFHMINRIIIHLTNCMYLCVEICIKHVYKEKRAHARRTLEDEKKNIRKLRPSSVSNSRLDDNLNAASWWCVSVSYEHNWCLFTKCEHDKLSHRTRSKQHSLEECKIYSADVKFVW